MSSESKPPTVFVSYSWTSDEYAERVVDFVTDLRNAGIEVVFDRYDLTEGQDKHAFMERTVTDPTVDRVLILCDPLYAEKADGRRGGVGTETLIISPKVYASAEEDRFIPVIMERDGDQIRVPTYLEGRIYVDLTGSDRIVHFQRLVRRLHGKPEIVRTPLGAPPAYLAERRPELRTGRTADIFRDAVERERRNQVVLLEDYLERLAKAMTEETAFPGDPPETPDEWAVETIERLSSYRDEFTDLLVFIARYDERVRFAGILHAFFEALLTARRQLAPRHYREEVEATPLAFLTWELFLITVAALIRKERFEHLAVLFEPLHSPGRGSQGSPVLQGFDRLNPGFPLIDETRKHRLGVNRISLSADLAQERVDEDVLPLGAMIEADCLCWLRSALRTEWDSWSWYPYLLVFGRSIESLPLFVRAGRASVFERLAPALGVRDHADLINRWERIGDGALPMPRVVWGGRERYERLFQLEHLGAKT